MRALIFSLVLFIFSGNAFADKVELQKVIEKSFKNIRGGGLNFDSKYADLILADWDKDEISIRVEVVVSAKSKEKAEELLSCINPKLTETYGFVYVTTEFCRKFCKQYCKKKKKGYDFDIKYIIKAPADIAYALKSSYGDIAIARITGDTDINIRFGNLLAKDLSFSRTQPLNKIKVCYGGTDIHNCNHADLEVCYGSLKLKKSQLIKLDSRYSDVKIGTIGKLYGKIQYGSFKLGSANTVQLDSRYTEVDIRSVSKRIGANIRYGGMDIGFVEPGFEELRIASDYGDVDIAFSEDACYFFNGKSRYGSIELPNKFLIDKHIKENFSETIEGSVGNPDKTSGGRVLLKVSYGEIELD